MQLSKLDNLVYEELKKNNLNIFKIRDICLILKIKKTKAYNIVKSLKKKKVLKTVGKNFLAIKGTDEFIIAASLNNPSYISFWTALNYYGFSDQTPKKIFLVTTKYTKEINNFKYVTLSKKRFFGYQSIGEIIIAEKEKAIIDSLLFPKYAGGITEIKKAIIKALPELIIKKLIDYAIQIENKAVLRRLGFILENLKYSKAEMNKLKRRIGKGYELLDPSLKRKNNLNKKWLLDINT